MIRPACLSDAEVSNQLSSEELGYPVDLAVTQSQLAKLLPQPGQIILVAENHEGQVVGYLHASDYQAIFSHLYLNIMGLAVAQIAHGQGHGCCFIAALEEDGRRLGYEGTRLNSGISREGVHVFYRAVGYAQRDDQKRFYKVL